MAKSQEQKEEGIKKQDNNVKNEDNDDKSPVKRIEFLLEYCIGFRDYFQGQEMCSKWKALEELINELRQLLSELTSKENAPTPQQIRHILKKIMEIQVAIIKICFRI